MDNLAHKSLLEFSADNRKKSPPRSEVYSLVGATAEALADQVRELSERLAQVEKNGVRFRGVYQRAAAYRRGDQATHKGSLWTALQDIPEGSAPGDDPALWQLSAKGTG